MAWRTRVVPSSVATASSSPSGTHPTKSHFDARSHWSRIFLATLPGSAVSSRWRASSRRHSRRMQLSRTRIRGTPTRQGRAHSSSDGSLVGGRISSPWSLRSRSRGRRRGRRSCPGRGRWRGRQAHRRRGSIRVGGAEAAGVEDDDLAGADDLEAAAGDDDAGPLVDADADALGVRADDPLETVEALADEEVLVDDDVGPEAQASDSRAGPPALMPAIITSDMTAAPALVPAAVAARACRRG